jgi:hypothetical protein
MTNKQGEDIKKFYPISSTPEILFRSIFNKNSLNNLNQMNFLAKNYRPKCDMCSNLCGIDWYLNISINGISSTDTKINAKEEDNLHHIRDSLLICEVCYDSANFPKGLKKDSFETANFFNIVNPSESTINLNFLRIQ